VRHNAYLNLTYLVHECVITYSSMTHTYVYIGQSNKHTNKTMHKPLTEWLPWQNRVTVMFVCMYVCKYALSYSTSFWHSNISNFRIIIRNDWWMFLVLIHVKLSSSWAGSSICSNLLFIDLRSRCFVIISLCACACVFVQKDPLPPLSTRLLCRIVIISHVC